MKVVPVHQLLDNYAYVFVDPDGIAGAVDVAEAGPVLEEVDRLGARLTAVLSTHHHYDHVGGNEEILARCEEGIEIYGSREEADRVPGLTRALADGESFRVGSLEVRAIYIPAHTRGHVAYYFEREGVVFTGDTLFAGGCGRLFEGDAAQMLDSLRRLASLPDDTLVYCGHEYTQANLEFAAVLEPNNPDLARRREEVAALLAQGKPTVPTTIAIEKRTNPFLRSDSPELRASIAERTGVRGDTVAVFAATRRLKDEF